MSKILSNKKFLKDIVNDNTLSMAHSYSSSDPLLHGLNKSTIQNAKIGKNNILSIQFNNCGHEFGAAIKIEDKEELQKGVDGTFLRKRALTYCTHN